MSNRIKTILGNIRFLLSHNLQETTERLDCALSATDTTVRKFYKSYYDTLHGNLFRRIAELEREVRPTKSANNTLELEIKRNHKYIEILYSLLFVEMPTLVPSGVITKPGSFKDDFKDYNADGVAYKLIHEEYKPHEHSIKCLVGKKAKDK